MADQLLAVITCFGEYFHAIYKACSLYKKGSRSAFDETALILMNVAGYLEYWSELDADF